MSAEELLEKLENYMKDKDINSEDEYNNEVLKFLNEIEEKTIDQSPILEEYSEDDIYYNIPEDSAKRLAKKTLESDPNNYSARNFLSLLEVDLRERLKQIKLTLEILKKELNESNLFNEEFKGDFWIIVETRPYIKTKYLYIETLIELKNYKEAVAECVEMLELSHSDNLGIRYILMNLYSILNNKDKLIDLYERYEDRSLRMLIPLATYYYKNNEEDLLYETIELIQQSNPFFIDYIKGENLLSLDEIEDIEDSDSYIVGTIDEIYIYFSENEYLMESTNIIEWLKENY